MVLSREIKFREKESVITRGLIESSYGGIESASETFIFDQWNESALLSKTQQEGRVGGHLVFHFSRKRKTR